ncbi:VanZ family protein [bacterium]|nr:VanZ family protein [bacterium]
MTPKGLAVRPFVWVERAGNAHPAIYYTLPLTLWIVAIMAACLVPGDDIPKIRVSDKLVHGLMYAGLGWLMLRAWVRDRQPTGAAVLLVALVATAWGFYIECLQVLTPDRSFDILDEASNVIGAAVGIGLWLVWQRIFSRISDGY